MTNKEAINELRDIYKEIDDVFIFTGEKKVEALDLAIKALEDRSQGEWVRKKDIIHYIAKQYSEHHELVPIWLRIGDMKSGEEE